MVVLLQIVILLLHLCRSDTFLFISPYGPTASSAVRRTSSQVAMKSAFATLFSGEPTERAKSLPHRSILSRSVVYSPFTGREIPLDTLLPPVTSTKQTAIVESILKWSRRYAESVQYSKNVTLVMVSIGLPEKAKALIDHLQLESYGTHDKLFVDDVDNTIYDALELNRGLQRTFFNPATPFSFLDRIVRPSGDGFKDLGLVLSKWNNAIYIPPKQAQALLQGGTFVFRGNDTLYAHYDPSTAAHAPMDQVVEIAEQPVVCR